MALAHLNFVSEVLGMTTSMYVILPQHDNERSQRPKTDRFPVLYFLHGLGGDQTYNLRFTPIHRIVASTDLAVVIPTVNRGCYVDMQAGEQYWSFISEELPSIARKFFPLSDQREKNFAAGISMGGYGAMKLALTFPERFASAASIMGSLDMVNFSPEHDEIAKVVFHPGEFHNIFGDDDKITGGKNDLFHMATQLVDSGKQKPKLFQCCGTEDITHAYNLRFRDHLRKLNYDLIYEEEAGQHNLEYVDLKLARIIQWFALQI